MSDVPFDAVTTYFVFLIGLPALAFQWLPAEVRPIVVKRASELLVDAGAPVLVAVVLVAAAVWAAPGPVWMWPAVLGMLFALAAYTAFRIPRKYIRRTAVVTRLHREVAARLERDGRLVEDGLQDLIELGKQSAAGRDKELVLEALADLANEVVGHEGYDGDRLADVSVGVLDLVVGSPQGTSAQNLATAADIPKRIVRAFDAAGAMQTDLLHAVRALSRLGRVAVAEGSEGVALSIVQTLATSGERQPATAVAVSEALFEIGLDAVEANQILIGMACAESLTALVENGDPVAPDTVADTLGLIAHFWVTGYTGRGYARRHLTRVEAALPDDMPDALEHAARHCAQTTRFRTADKVRAVIADLSQAPA